MWLILLCWYTSWFTQDMISHKNHFVSNFLRHSSSFSVEYVDRYPHRWSDPLGVGWQGARGLHVHLQRQSGCEVTGCVDSHWRQPVNCHHGGADGRRGGQQQGHQHLEEQHRVFRARVDHLRVVPCRAGVQRGPLLGHGPLWHLRVRLSGDHDQQCDAGSALHHDGVLVCCGGPDGQAQRRSKLWIFLKLNAFLGFCGDRVDTNKCHSVIVIVLN